MRLPSLFSALLFAQLSFGQVEGVFVERIPAPDGLTTYRIFIDLEPDHVLQTIYGDAKHTLTLSTTTAFFNDSVYGVAFGEQLDPERLRSGYGWADSFLAFGFASGSHKAVPMHLDTDGSIQTCQGERSHRCERDGLVIADRVPTTTNMNVATGYVNSMKGGLIQTDNGGWGVLGGVKGNTPENLVLVAQLTTDGTLSYALNVQVRRPDGIVLRCTPDATDNSEERHQPALRGTVMP
ncbi:MAG: hypothetical protein ACO1NQ_12670 [Flavobacteriales bacterium]